MNQCTLFFLPFFALASLFCNPAYYPKCEKANKILSDLEKNFQKGIYVYPPHKYKINRKSDGKQEIKIYGRNKSIGFLVNLTHIIPKESSHGDYMLTKEILQEWRQWLRDSCSLNGRK